MLYRRMDAPKMFSGLAAGTILLQSNLVSEETDSGKYVVAIYPYSASATWYFLSPDEHVWINGVDGAESVADCIVLFDDIQDAELALQRQASGFPESTRWALFKTVFDGSDLELVLFKEYLLGRP